MPVHATHNQGIRATGKAEATWICCQLGAREHYSIPRALARVGNLNLLVTDSWSPKRSLWTFIAGTRAAQRFHPDLDDAQVASMNWRTLAYEVGTRLSRNGWDRVSDRNRWFQREARAAIERQARSSPHSRVVLFSYSYAARELFEFARKCGWTTVLGQIDPGPVEERLVGKLHREFGSGGPFNTPPAAYWDEWREECRLADHIIVNSRWSEEALITEGIEQEKIEVIPLAYEPSEDQASFSRAVPHAFTMARRMRVLFLGQVNLRKGVACIFESIRLLTGQPVEFRIVGPVQIPIPEDLQHHPQVRFTGSATRTEAALHYRWADLFVFPTFSDGFGLTQLEAQSWKLPIVASRFCGDVVRNRRNGIVLEEVTGEHLARAISSLSENPQELAAMSAVCEIERRFTMAALSAGLASVAEGPK